MSAALLERLGLPGVIGAGLLLFCVVFYLAVVAPAQATRVELQERKAEQVALVGSPDAPASSRAPLLPFSAAPALLTQLNALADQNGVAIERTTYLLRDEGGVRHLDVSMPVKAGYPALRGFLRDAMTQKAASLEELSLQRSLVTETQLQAQVRLSFRFAATP